MKVVELDICSCYASFSKNITFNLKLVISFHIKPAKGSRGIVSNVYYLRCLKYSQYKFWFTYLKHVEFFNLFVRSSQYQIKNALLNFFRIWPYINNTLQKSFKWPPVSNSRSSNLMINLIINNQLENVKNCYHN